MMKQFRHQMTRLLCLTVCFVLFTGVVSAHDEVTKASAKHLLFGIAPFMSPLALVKRMAPLRDYLSDSLGIDVVIETTTDAREFAKRTLNGRYDFVLTNPTFSLMAMDHGGFQIVGSQKNKLSGCFVVLETSEIQSIKDLAGKRIGAPPKVGFMGQLIGPYIHQIDFDGGQLPEIKNFHSHNDAILALRHGDTDATLLVSFMEKHLRAKGLPLRTIHRTEKYPGMTVLASQHMTPEYVNKLRASLYALDQNEQGKKVLKKISLSGFEELNLMALEKVRPYLPPNNLK